MDWSWGWNAWDWAALIILLSAIATVLVVSRRGAQRTRAARRDTDQAMQVLLDQLATGVITPEQFEQKARTLEEDRQRDRPR